MSAGEYDVEIIDLDTDELGEFDALAVCRDPTGPTDDDEDVAGEEQDQPTEVLEEA